MRRRAVLHDGAARGAASSVSVADWPSWDPLPPRLEVYRRLVGGEVDRASRRRGRSSRSTDRTARAATRGRSCRRALLERVRAHGGRRPIRARPYRGEELRGEVRPLKRRLPARRDSRARISSQRLLGRDAAARARGGALPRRLVRGRVATAGASGVRSRQLVPRGGRTFRGRLVALFVLSVMVPLVAVTFFLRSSIATRSRRDTLDHGRTALETARRVLDDYLPSAAAALGRLGLLDDTLLSWLANAVGLRPLHLLAGGQARRHVAPRPLSRPACCPSAFPGRPTSRSGSARRASAPTRG